MAGVHAVPTGRKHRLTPSSQSHAVEPLEKRVTFSRRGLAFALVAPQLVVTLVFFIWPASQALYQSVLLEDAFGLSRQGNRI